MENESTEHGTATYDTTPIGNIMISYCKDCESWHILDTGGIFDRMWAYEDQEDAALSIAQTIRDMKDDGEFIG